MEYTDAELQNEVWKDIKNFEGCYQVSNLGRIRSLKREVLYKNSTRIIKEKMFDFNDSTSFMQLCKHDIQIAVNPKILVSNYFIDNMYQYDYVAVRDNNPKNLRASNLQGVNIDDTCLIFDSTLKYSICYYNNLKIRVSNQAEVSINNNNIRKIIYEGSLNYKLPYIALEHNTRVRLSLLLLFAFKPDEVSKHVIYKNGNHNDLRLSNLTGSKHKHILIANTIPDYINPNT